MQDKIEFAPDGCWNWTGGISAAGYGVISNPGRGTGFVYAHRAMYEHVLGAIPEGLHIDHLCRNRRCINPGHLEAVTQALNNIRATQGPDADGTCCKRGHLFSEANTYITPSGARRCRTCTRERARIFARRKAA